MMKNIKNKTEITIPVGLQYKIAQGLAPFQGVSQWNEMIIAHLLTSSTNAAV
jgi:hypothetical protein